MVNKNRYYDSYRTDYFKATLQGIIKGYADPLPSFIRMNGGGYNGLVDIGFDKHFRVNHGENEFANDDRHINGIELFWSYAKRRLAKFNGVPGHTFYLHLKETDSALA